MSYRHKKTNLENEKQESEKALMNCMRGVLQSFPTVTKRPYSPYRKGLKGQGVVHHFLLDMIAAPYLF